MSQYQAFPIFSNQLFNKKKTQAFASILILWILYHLSFEISCHNAVGKSSIPFNQSGIGVWAIIMTAKTAPANAATPITAAIFLLMSLLTILQISIAQTTQTAAVASAMTNVSHNHENSCNILIHSPYLSLANTGICLPFFDSKYFSVCF